MTSPSTLKRTALFDKHLELGARMMPFGGYEMPVQYESIIQEHMAVRDRAGLFDVSHMGEIYVRGPNAFGFIQHLVTNDASKLYDGRAMYTVMCTTEGGVVDDLLVYRFADDAYMLVVNAANIEKDLEWMQTHNEPGAELTDASESTALLAIQGPASIDMMQQLIDEPLDDLRYYHFIRPAEGAFLGCRRAIISRTGYTGETGFEIYCETERAEDVWDALMEAGADDGLEPAGLGARDTLRLEAGFCLYGNDMTEATNPLEAGLGWLVKLDNGDFIGRDALRNVRETGPERKLVGFVMQDRGIPRSGHLLLDPEGTVVGEVTSGSQSPVLQRGIGLGYVPNDDAYTEPGSTVLVQARGRQLKAKIQDPPFHKK